MKSISRYIAGLFLVFFYFPPVIYANGDGTARITLEELDEVVSDTDRYNEARFEKIRSCMHQIDTCDDSEKARLYNIMFGMYYGFQSDSALVYAKKGIEAGRKTNNPGEELSAKINLATLYNMTGSYHEALQLLDSVDRKQLDRSRAASFYSVYNTLYEALKNLSIDRALQDRYAGLAVAYKDSILMLEPDNILVTCDKLIIEGNIHEALLKIKPFCDMLDKDDPAVGVTAYAVSDIYRRLQERELEKEYLILSARSDLIQANKEYISLTRLARRLYEDGDILRAYNYLNRSLEDATFCTARQRISEVSPMLSIVNASYKTMNRRWLTVLAVISSILLLMAAALIILTSYLQRQRIRLSQTNTDLTHSQRLLETANIRIGEASNIKNTYITHLMLECIARIENLESYRKSLRKMALASDLDALRKELKSNDFPESEWKAFYHTFDTTFLSLFPTFATDFNNLLKPENRFAVPDMKLTPELRIYALIRLEIDSTEKIASLLRYSRATIYAYRSRTRLKAFDPDKFEENIKQISSI